MRGPAGERGSTPDAAPASFGHTSALQPDPVSASRRYGRRLLQTLRDRTLLSLVAAIVAYTSVWSAISIIKLEAMDATVYDLGLSIQVLLEIVSGNWTHQVILTVLMRPIAILVAPLALLHSIDSLLVFQSAFIGLGALPLYSISLRLLNDKRTSIMISAAYLIYPPLAGTNWFDFHFQVLFMTLFMLGYLYFLKGRFVISFLLMLLSGLARFPYMVFPLLFSILTMLTFLARRGDGYTWITERGFRAAVLSTTAFSGILAVTSIIVPIYTQVPLAIDISGASVYYGLICLFLVALPLLGVQFFSKFWTIMSIPFFFEAFFSGNASFTYPRVFMLQYVAGVVPFMFLGFVDALAKWRAREPSGSGGGKFARQALQKQRKVVAAAFAVCALAAILLQPYGPLNQISPVSYGFYSQAGTNQTQLDDMQLVASALPANADYVLIQNNMPQLIPQLLRSSTGAHYMVAGETHFGSDYSIQNNSFPVVDGKSTVVDQIDYLVLDPFSHWFYAGSPSMYNISSTLYSSGTYGVAAEAGGMVLLERNYTGSARDFSHFSEVFPADQLYNGSTLRHPSGGTVTHEGLEDGQIAWYGPYTTLLPGTYRVTFEIMTGNTSPNNLLELQVCSNQSKDILFQQPVRGYSLMHHDKWTNVTIQLRVNDIYGFVEFRGVGVRWTGTISLSQISVQQLNNSM